jgi:glycosyltransferase involved in cell wall biosynthesis
MQKISLICPTHNEKNNLKVLFDSILNQTKRPNEIIFIEDSSTDNTFSVLSQFKTKIKNVKIFRVNNRNISKNRNLAVEKSKNEIIVCVDAGCKLTKTYLEKITEPFKNKKIFFVAGVSKLIPKNLFDECFDSFVTKDKFSQDYLPKGHAMAFRKSLWKKIGGFPEHLALGAEDTYFGRKAVAEGYKPFIVENAIVNWETRRGLRAIYKQFNNYGYWDGRAFSLSELPKNSKLSLIVSVLFPLEIAHAFYKGIRLLSKFRKIRAFYYGLMIDLFKVYGYLFGWCSGVRK